MRACSSLLPKRPGRNRCLLDPMTLRLPAFHSLFHPPTRPSHPARHMFFCVAVGLWGGLVIGLVTEYYTSNRFQPVQASMPGRAGHA